MLFSLFSYIRIASTCLILVLITSCGGGGGSSPPPSTPSTPALSFGDEIADTSGIIQFDKILLGDLDNDNDLDIVALSQVGMHTIYTNNGIFTGGGLSTVAINATISLPDSATTGDLGDINGDLFIDLVTPAFNNTEANNAFINDQAGGFNPSTDIQSDTDESRDLKLVDLDNDGNTFLDLYVANNGINKSYNNDGSANFSAGVDIGTPAVNNTHALVFEDFDGVSGPDMLVADPLTPICIHFNTGGALSTTCTDVTDPGTSGQIIATGDVNGDTFIDIIYVEPLSNRSHLYTNNGIGVFSNTDMITTIGSTIITGSALGDIDGDMDIDYVVSSRVDGPGTQEFVKVHLNDGTGQFAAAIPLGSNGDNTMAVALGDLDDDGDLDIVIAKDSGAIIAFENQY